MKKHTKIYLEYFDYCEQDFIPCEICGRQAVDIHHIYPRGMGGSDSKDFIENLIGLCRDHHNQAESKKISKEELIEIHTSEI